MDTTEQTLIKLRQQNDDLQKHLGNLLEKLADLKMQWSAREHAHVATALGCPSPLTA